MIINMRQGRGYRGFRAADEEEVSEAPSRATWFLIGAVTAFLGPTLLALVTSGGRAVSKRVG
jgi:hypothetical protein